jgi:hypothetical protein
MASGLTEEQKEAIEKKFQDVWNTVIYDDILTDAQKNDPRTMKMIAYEIEGILNALAAHFVLSALA